MIFFPAAPSACGSVAMDPAVEGPRGDREPSLEAPEDLDFAKELEALVGSVSKVLMLVMLMYG
jgi:hypothetical protein